MTDFLGKLVEAPLSTILVVAGLAFLFIGLGGEFTDKILTSKIPKGYATGLGVALIALGLLLYFLPESRTAPKPDDDGYQDAERLTFKGSRENSGSIFEDLKSAERQRFGSQETKHNDICWVGRRRHSSCTAFVDIHLLLPGVPLDRIRVEAATFQLEEMEVEGDDVTRWLGPLMVLALDYGELDVGDGDNVLENGQTVRSYENLFELYKPTDVTTVVRGLFQRRAEHLRLVFVFPGRAQDKESPGIVRFEPNKVRAHIELKKPKGI